MKKIMVLLAGYPGTGKSFLCSQIMAMTPDFVSISQDDIKEGIFEEHGYDNLAEKEQLTKLSWERFYDSIEQNMLVGNRIISDYPFSEKQRGRLEELTLAYDYQVLTIRMLADIDILFERQKKRDLDPERHLSHIVSHYHAGDELVDRSQADCLLSYEEFYKRCTTRGYDQFVLGDLIEVDVSDFTQVDYPALLGNIKEYL